MTVAQLVAYPLGTGRFWVGRGTMALVGFPMLVPGLVDSTQNRVKAKDGPTSNVRVSNVGVLKRKSHQTSESQTAEYSNVGVGKTSECSNVRVIIA